MDEGVDGHGADQFLVTDCFAVFECDNLIVSVDFLDRTLCAKLGLFFGDGVCYGNPDATRATISWEAEGGIRTPVASRLLEDDILGDGLEIWSGNWKMNGRRLRDARMAMMAMKG